MSIFNKMTVQEKTRYEEWMRRCISLARIAKNRGDSPAGAILVHGDNIISEGIEAGKTRQDITCHAETEAIRQAVKLLKTNDLSDCILVTTHEPCIMCSYVVRHHRISRIVVGVTTGEIGGYSSALPVLLDTTVTRWANPPVIIGGILEQECRALRD